MPNQLSTHQYIILIKAKIKVQRDSALTKNKKLKPMQTK